MSRSYAPIYTNIWQNADFAALSANAQRVYLLLLSQPNIAYTGVISRTSGRWARMAGDTNVDDVDAGITELAECPARFVLVDDDTEELWIRTFIRHNRVIQQPQLRTAMVRAYPAILSERLRRALFESLPPATQEELQKSCSTAIPPPCPQPDAHPARTLLAGSPEGSLLSVTRCSASLTGDREHSTADPEPPSSSSCSDLSAAEPPADDDDDDRVVTEACLAFAERKFDQQLAEGQRIGHRDNWLAATAKGARSAVLRWLEIHPDDTPETIAAGLLPEPPPTFATGGTATTTAQPPDFEPDDEPAEYDPERIRALKAGLRP